MVQPIQYQVPGVTDPFASVVQGLRLGATLQELDLARAAQQQKLAQQQAQAEQQRQANDAISAYLAKPSGQRTEEDTRGLVRFLPAEQVRNLIDIDSRLSEVQRRNQVLFAGQVGSALRLGNTDVALQMVRQRADAETDPMKKQGFQILAQSIEKAPEAALETLRVSTTALGKDYEPAAKAMFGAPAEQGRMISTPEAKRAAGLVNDKGAPLPGTFFQEPGKEPKLITGETPKDQFVTTNAEGLAKRFGITGAEPGLYKVNTATNEVSAVGRGGTTVNMKTEGPPPPGYQYERDAQGNVVKMVPIPGGPAAEKLAAQQRAQTATEAGRLQAATIVVDDIKGLTDLLDVEAKATGFDKASPYVQVTGITGKASEGLPGSARAAAQGLLDSVKANIGFEQLNKMRQESPTGGALGNITEQELKFLQSTLGTLNLDLPPVTLRRNLTRVKEVYDSVMRKAAAYPNAAQYGFGTAAPAAAPNAVPAAAPVATPAAVATPTVTTRALPTQGAMDFLRRNPSLRGAFDQKYGPGMADRILGGQ